MKNGIAKQIMSGYGDLRKSEKKAADYILKNMEQAAELSIDRLAEAAGVSQPTVLRMLRAFGFSGYKDFKYQLVSELAQSEAEQQGEAEPMFGYILRKQDTLEEIPSYMTATAAGMMEETLKNFSVKTYRKTVEAIRKARLIDIYSVENSGVAAQDLLAKLLYLGLPCRYFSDSYYQRISAGSLTQLLIVDMIYMGIIASDYEHYVGLLDQGEKIVRERAYPHGAEKRKKKKP